MNLTKSISTLLAAAAIAAATGLGACSGSADSPEAAATGNEVVLQFSLTTGAAGSDGSRAVDICDGEEKADAWEDYLFTARTNILIYRHTDSADGALIARFTGSDLGGSDRLASSVTLRLADDYLLNIRDAVVDIVVVANAELPADFSSIEKVAAHSCSYSKPSETSGIPMYGIRRGIYLGYLAGEGTEESPLMCGTVNLLRAYAKTEVLSSLPEGYTLTDVTVTTAQGKSFYPAPYNAAGKWHLTNTTDITAPCVPSAAATADFTGATSERATRFYLPESPASTGNYITLSVTGPDGKKTVTDRKIELGLYDEEGKFKPGSSLDIIRNHIYRYEIAFTPDADVTLMVRVRKWGYHKIEFDM